MKLYKNKIFHRWAKNQNLSDANLINAVDEMVSGLYEVNLGGCVYKKRIAITGRGKRGGIRAIIAFKHDDKAIFIYGFAKNERANITPKEEEALKMLAKTYFSYSEDQIYHAIQIGELIEVSL